MLITCPKCGKQYSDTVNVCIHCGEPITNYKKCPECYNWCLKYVTKCSKCGYDFEKAAREAESERQSRRCTDCIYYEDLRCYAAGKGFFNSMDATTCDKYYYSEFAHENNGGCYLTSACVEYYGKSDDCYELQTLRKFRDEVLKKTPEGQNLVDEYYKIAPPVVERLHELNDSKNYEYIYSQILICIKHIENQEYEKAVDVYTEMCKKMQKI